MTAPKMGELGRVTQLSDSALDLLPADARLRLPAEEQKRLREDEFRRAAYALVQKELIELSRYTSVAFGHAARGPGVVLRAHQHFAQSRSLIDAVDEIKAKVRA